jgi:hypothetical protein
MTLLEFGPPVVFMKTPASSPNIKSEIKPKKAYAFDAQAFLDSGSLARKIVEFNTKETIFSQPHHLTSRIQSSLKIISPSFHAGWL